MAFNKVGKTFEEDDVMTLILSASGDEWWGVLKRADGNLISLHLFEGSFVTNKQNFDNISPQAREELKFLDRLLRNVGYRPR